MPLDRSPIRESGSSNLNRPRPAGDFDGSTRVQAMRDLLAKHEEPKEDELDRHPVHRFWAKRARRVLGLAVFVLLVRNGDAHACTITAKHNEPATVTDCNVRPSPAEAAAIVSRLEHPVTCERCDGPYIYIINSTPGALSWLTFPPESPRRRLDGTLLTQRPTVYGAVRSESRHRR
jgi:hypothetical protein